MAVRIGITVPTSYDPLYNEQCGTDYVQAVRRASGEAALLDPRLTSAALEAMVQACNGYVLPGSPADVDPSGYGQEREAATARPDVARDECDRLILEHAAGSGKPVLAICYGMQHLNVWLGGTLVQDLTPLPVNHAAGANVAIAHTALVTSQSLLGSLLTASEAPPDRAFRRLPVNSSHHQAIAAAGEHLAVVARCNEDGVIEAVEGRVGLATMLGVQWHPERSVDLSAASRALFTWLVLEAEDHGMPVPGGERR